MNEYAQLMKKYEIRPIKSLGQNFLIDDNILQEIVEKSNITKDDYVIEVGPGTGTLTKLLAQRAGFVTSVEIDTRLKPLLLEEFKDVNNIRFIWEDILKADKDQILEGSDMYKNIKVIANLPYYITTPILFKFLEEYTNINLMSFMVQKEVAKRICASAGIKDYGILTIATQYYSNPQIVIEVDPTSFIPRPNVNSAVVLFEMLKEPPVNVCKEEYFRLVKIAFSQRRKTLANCIANSQVFNLSKEEIKDILKEMFGDSEIRGERLDLFQFEKLSSYLLQKHKN